MNNRFVWYQAGICLFFLSVFGMGKANQLSEARQKYSQVEKKIQYSENNLKIIQKKRGKLLHQLARYEKKISQIIIQKKKIEHLLKKNHIRTLELGKQTRQLKEQIRQEQTLLASHVYTRYAINEHQPLKWILIPGQKSELQHTLIYYQYIIRAQQECVREIANKIKRLNHKERELQQHIEHDKQLSQTLNKEQDNLKSVQSKQKKLINTLNKNILSKTEQLKEYQKSQNALSYIIKNLSKQDRVAQNKSFSSRRHHLPRPVSIPTSAIKTMQQGLTFFAPAGTTVRAVHPGKILFSDWLKGYGLLLIIDHGHGFMTLYAHNQSLTKQKGEWVQGNEKIAEVGHSGGLLENGLYFEIRQNGKTISPINWLT